MTRARTVLGAAAGCVGVAFGAVGVAFLIAAVLPVDEGRFVVDGAGIYLLLFIGWLCYDSAKAARKRRRRAVCRTHPACRAVDDAARSLTVRQATR